MDDFVEIILLVTILTLMCFGLIDLIGPNTHSAMIQECEKTFHKRLKQDLEKL